MLALGLAACDRAPAPAERAEHSEPPPTNRVEIPGAVRQNLGITFAAVETRPVARTIRIPGRFELLPSARREYHAPLGGRVEPLVQQYQSVAEGAPLYRLDAPGWRELQQQIAAAQGAVRRTQAAVANVGPLIEAHHRHHEELEQLIGVWAERVRHLEELAAAGGAKGADRTEATARLAEARADLAEVMEKEAELEARRAEVQAELDTSSAQLRLLLGTAETLTGVPAERLASEGAASPLWLSLGMIEVRAAVPGIVESMAAAGGAWVEAKSPVLATVQPTLVRFRARGLQSDLGRLRDGLPARIVPPQGGTLGPAEPIPGLLTVGLSADPNERTIDLLVASDSGGAWPGWARAGVSGFLEITAEGAQAPELAIPLAAVIRDGLTPVIFRRDPKDPDKAIRLEADLGIDDGRWVVVRSGLREGDQVVLDGVYQLMLESSGSAAKGGHFHSDGAFHEGGHEGGDNHGEK